VVSKQIDTFSLTYDGLIMDMYLCEDTDWLVIKKIPSFQ
jgi:hypothetical protein